MENEPTILKGLRNNDPQAFKKVYDQFIHQMIQQAVDHLGHYVAANEIVTEIWITHLDNDFQQVTLPFDAFFQNQVNMACEFITLKKDSEKLLSAS